MKDYKERYYHPHLSTKEIFSGVDSLRGTIYETPDDKETLRLIEQAEYMSEEYEKAKKRARAVLLKSSSVITGTIEDLLNDEHIMQLLDKKTRFFDVALVHNASAFTDTELMSLLLFGVRKMICLTMTAQGQSDCIATRMVRKAESSTDYTSQSCVLDQGTYLNHAERRRKEAEEKRRASYSHSHSFKPVTRMCTDVRTRDCYQEQAERTQIRPNVPQLPGRGSAHSSRGRGQDHRVRGRGDAYQSLHVPTGRWRGPRRK